MLYLAEVKRQSKILFCDAAWLVWLDIKHVAFYLRFQVLITSSHLRILYGIAHIENSQRRRQSHCIVGLIMNVNRQRRRDQEEIKNRRKLSIYFLGEKSLD